MATAALYMLAQWIIEKAFKGAVDVPNTATVQLKPTLASLYREAAESPAPVTLSYQIHQLPRHVVGDGGGVPWSIDYSCFVFAWILLCLSIGFCLSSLRGQAVHATKTAALVHIIKMLNATVGTFERTIKENSSKIVELTELMDSLHDQANDAKAEARRYETLFYEMKSKLQYYMDENLILRSTIFVPSSTLNGDIQDKPDSTIPSGTLNSDAAEEPNDLPQKVEDNLPQPETKEDAPPKKSRNRRRRNKRAMKPEPEQTPADEAEKGEEPDNEIGADEPRTGLSAWNSFQSTSAREEATKRQRAAQQLALRKAEEARTGVRPESQLPEFKETWRQVKVADNQRRIVGVAKGQPST